MTSIILVVTVSFLGGYIVACGVFVLSQYKRDKAIEKEISKGGRFNNHD